MFRATQRPLIDHGGRPRRLIRRAQVTTGPRARRFSKGGVICQRGPTAPREVVAASGRALRSPADHPPRATRSAT